MRRRQPRVVVRRGPSLLGTMATVGAGMAMGSARARGQAQEAAQNAQIAQMQAQMQEAQMQAAQPAPAAAGQDRIAQPQDLAALKEAGVLTEEEFQAEKQRILAGG